MKRIPLHATVVCTDGTFGETIRVIVDPKTLLPTHIVVKAAEDTHDEYLVAASHVAETDHGVVRLDITCERVASMDRFSYTEYREIHIPRYAGAEATTMPYQYYDTEVVDVRREVIPEGTRALAPGMNVRAGDSTVGTVDELVLDDESGALTHFIMREKHVWGDKAILIPLQIIDRIADNVVYLTPEKEVIESYLAMPTRRHEAAEEMELIILLVDRPDKPKEMLKTVQEAAQRDGLQIYGSAVLHKNAEGKAVIRETGDMDRRGGAVFGAVTGGLVGLLGGPAGVIVGAVAGAATGGVAAKRIDLGLPDPYLQKLQSQLQPGSAAVVALLEAGWDAKATNFTFGLEAELLRHQLDDDVLDRLAPA